LILSTPGKKQLLKPTLKRSGEKPEESFTAEQKILIVMEALRAETSVVSMAFRNQLSKNGTKNFLRPVRNAFLVM